jgi:hypothetical protein
MVNLKFESLGLAKRAFLEFFLMDWTYTRVGRCMFLSVVTDIQGTTERTLLSVVVDVRGGPPNVRSQILRHIL